LKFAAARVAAGLSSVFAVARSCERGLADRAGFCLNVGSAYVRTRPRAIERILSEFLVIAAKLTGISLKGFSAVFAGEANRLHFVSFATVLGFIGLVAGKFAEFSAGVFRLGAEKLATLLAGELDRHGPFLTSEHLTESLYGSAAVLSTEGSL